MEMGIMDILKDIQEGKQSDLIMFGYWGWDEKEEGVRTSPDYVIFTELPTDIHTHSYSTATLRSLSNT